MLLAWNVIVFLLQQLEGTLLRPLLGMVPVSVWESMLASHVAPSVESLLGLVPVLVFKGWIWQFVTYMFLHGSFFHILFNMLALWMFGSELEYLWGTRRFVKYYFFTGVGAAITSTLVTPHSTIPTIGASGAIYGLLLAYGVTFPNRPILLYFLFPIRAKYFVILFGVVELLASFSQPHSGIAHFAHLGGLLFGWIYLKGFPGQRALRRWRRERQRRKFTVVDFRDNDEWWKR